MSSSTLLPAWTRNGPLPRIEVRPDSIVGTFGPEATALCAKAGLILDGWQSDAVDLMLSFRADGQWACFEYGEVVSRQNGKGAILEARCLAGMLLFNERLIIWTAHQDRTAKQSFKRMCTLFRALGMLITAENPGGSIQAMRANGSRALINIETEQEIQFMTRSKDAGRGFSGDCVIFDEAYALVNEQIEATVPTMSARPNGQMIQTSTPPLKGDTAEPMYSMRQRAEDGEEGIGYRDWGLKYDIEELEEMAESEARAILGSLDNQRATNPAMGYRITPEFTRRELGMYSMAGFARERLGCWPRRLEGAGAIDAKLWASLIDTESRRVGDVAVAIDVSPRRDYAAIMLYGHRADGLGHVQILDYHPGTGWLMERVAEISAILDPVAWGIASGTHRSLSEDLDRLGIKLPEDPEKPERGQICLISGMDMAAACGQAFDAVKQRSLRYRPPAEGTSDPMQAAILGAQIRQNADQIAWARKESASDISPVVGWTLARRTYYARVEKVKKTYVPAANFH